MRFIVASVLFTCAFGIAVPALASGTARITQPDGEVKTYSNVRITFEKKQMFVRSADGVGTLVIDRAGCTAIDKLIRCHPYDAVVNQHGSSQHLVIASGTAWLNPGKQSETLPHSSTRLPPKGVVLTMKTKAGTYFSLSGVADQVKK